MNLGDNNELRLGDGNDLGIWHNGSNSIINDEGVGDLYLGGNSSVNITNAALSEFKAKFITDGAVELYHDASKKFETTSTGIDVTGHTETDTLNVSGLSTFAGVTTFHDNAFFGDNDQIIMGDGPDLKIYHDGDDSYVEDTGIGALIMKGSTLRFRSTTDEKIINAHQNGSVDLFYDNSKKFATTGYGVSVTGGLDVSGISTFSGDIGSSLIPASDDTHDLGAPNDQWRNLYIDGLANVDALLCSGNADFLSNVEIGGNITITSTDTGSSAAPEFKLYRNSASPANADYLGQIKFAGESDTGVERNYAKITGKISDASNGTEDGIIEIAHIKAGSQNISARFKSTELMLMNGTKLSVDGSSTFTGIATANGGIDVTGHTETDTLNVSGLSTFQSNISVTGVNTSNFTGNIGIGTTQSVSASELEIYSDDFSNVRILSTRTGGSQLIGGVGFSTIGADGTSETAGTINCRVDGDMIFSNAVESFRIHGSDGKVEFSQGLSFGDDKLDEYDEGSFTPSYQTANDDINNVNYDAQTGHYTRIGNMCYFIMRLRTSSIGNVGSGTLEVHGLPFTHVNNTNNRAVVLLTTSGWTDGNAPTLGFFHQNTNTFKLTQKSATQDPTNLSSSVLNTSGNKNEIRVTGMYRCI